MLRLKHKCHVPDIKCIHLCVWGDINGYRKTVQHHSFTYTMSSHSPNERMKFVNTSYNLLPLHHRSIYLFLVHVNLGTACNKNNNCINYIIQSQNVKILGIPSYLCVFCTVLYKSRQVLGTYILRSGYYQSRFHLSFTYTYSGYMDIHKYNKNISKGQLTFCEMLRTQTSVPLTKIMKHFAL